MDMAVLPVPVPMVFKNRPFESNMATTPFMVGRKDAFVK